MAVMQLFCENRSFRIDGLDDSDTISLSLHLCVPTPDTCRHSIQAVLSISVISNSHSVTNTFHGPYIIVSVLEHAFIEDL
jgi:hypothetical protein